MKIYTPLKQLIDLSFIYVINTCSKYNIDDSHSLIHSIDVLRYANKIYDTESKINQSLDKYKNVIFLSAVLHDMCDDKYMDQNRGVTDIEDFLKPHICVESIGNIKTIISTMSYTKVKSYGFPELGEMQTAYNIVREADLLAAYDIKRSIIYNMYQNKENEDRNFSYSNVCAEFLFLNRVLKHFDDELFVTESGKEIGKKLHDEVISEINEIKHYY